MQLYCYDFSEFSKMALNADGTFGYPEFIEEQFGPNHTTFLIRSGGDLAGFAIVTPAGDAGATMMAQFFVMRGHRRAGVGQLAATRLFDTYAGAWEVHVIEENRVALAFWREIIARYTNGDFEPGPYELGNDRGTLFTFRSRGTKVKALVN